MIGETISHYRVLSQLGAGGMGEVYLAEDSRLGRKVAVKLLPPGLAADEDARRRFAQEARAASALNHPSIITIYDIGTEQGRDFIAMEFVDGESLRTTLGRGRLDIKHALQWISQAASALAAAHDAGIIHRDIKPENLMVSPSNHVKVLDFGLAKLVEKHSSVLAHDAATATDLGVKAPTRSGVIVGTFAYMSPEQAEGRPLDRRADIFSLGLVLYELLTGQKAFAANSAIDTLHKVVHDDILRQLRTRTPSCRLK